MNEKRGVKKKLVRKNYLISVVQAEKIQQEVAAQQISESEIIRRAIDGYLIQKRRESNLSKVGEKL